MIRETSAHLVAEAAVAEEIARAWRCQLEKTKRLAMIDYIMWRGDEKAGSAEIKCRDKQYGTLMIDEEKLHALDTRARFTGTPSFLFVRWPHGIYWWKVADVPFLEYAMGGRVDRGDQLDTDLVIHIPVQRFRPLEILGIPQSDPV